LGHLRKPLAQVVEAGDEAAVGLAVPTAASVPSSRSRLSPTSVLEIPTARPARRYDSPSTSTAATASRRTSSDSGGVPPWPARRGGSRWARRPASQASTSAGSEEREQYDKGTRPPGRRENLAYGLVPVNVKVIPGRNYGVTHEYDTADHEHFWNTVNAALREHRISFELVGDTMIPFASKELHTEIVVPTMRLLSGRVGWDKVESAYQDALREIADGKPADAITDAGTALQEAFVTLGCLGNSLGVLAKSARSKGLFAPHDVLMTETLHKLVDWVSADRSEKGDVHQAREPSVDDAWLTVHIVGAIILRLVGPTRD
jgi:hypothetical protein